MININEYTNARYNISEGGKEMEVVSIYYDDNTNSFEDEDGCDEDSLVGIMTAEDTVKCKREGGTYYRTVDNIMYEIVFPYWDDKRELYYDVKENVMFNEDGDTVFNIFSIISASALYLFKKGKKTMEVPTINGGWAVLIWPDCLP